MVWRLGDGVQHLWVPVRVIVSHEGPFVYCLQWRQERTRPGNDCEAVVRNVRGVWSVQPFDCYDVLLPLSEFFPFILQLHWMYMNPLCIFRDPLFCPPNLNGGSPLSFLNSDLLLHTWIFSCIWSSSNLIFSCIHESSPIYESPLLRFCVFEFQSYISTLSFNSLIFQDLLLFKL